MSTVSRVNQNSIRVNFIPSRKKEDENAEFATPMGFSGTPEELDRELGRNLAAYVEENLRLQSTLTEAEAEMEAAAKVARDQARSKSGQNTKKAEQSAPGELPHKTEATAEQNMTLLPRNRNERRLRRYLPFPQPSKKVH